MTSRTGVPPVDPFDGWFDRPPSGNGPVTGSPAEGWIAHVGWGIQEGLYTYQQPFDTREGLRVAIRGRPMVLMSSYDYLGLIGHPAISTAAVDAVRRAGTGTGGVRLLTGTHELHVTLESELARFKGTEAAATFSSGYLANIAAVVAFAGPRDLIFRDALAHRSLADGCRLSRARARCFRHNDLDHLESLLRERPTGQRTLVVVDGVYSMDGDLCPLVDLVALKARYDFLLLVDEAHAIGTVGETGRGLHEALNLPVESVDIWTGSLSKGIPANGGYVAGRREAIIAVQHQGAPFVFSAALCPAATAAATEALRLIPTMRDRIARCRSVGDTLRQDLRALGLDTGRSESCIVPVMLGERDVAYRAARQLFDAGFLVSAAVPPAVGMHDARLRLCASAAADDEVLKSFLDAVAATVATPVSR